MYNYLFTVSLYHGFTACHSWGLWVLPHLWQRDTVELSRRCTCNGQVSIGTPLAWLGSIPLPLERYMYNPTIFKTLILSVTLMLLSCNKYMVCERSIIAVHVHVWDMLMSLLNTALFQQ